MLLQIMLPKGDMMKKIFSLLVLSMFLSVSAYAVSPPAYDFTGFAKRQIGAGQAVPVRVVKLVRHSLRGNSAAGINSGEAVVYDTNSADGITIRVTTTSSDATFAGIAVTAIETADANSVSAADDVGRRNWGYIVVHGPVQAEVGGDNDATAGDIFITSVDATKITGVEGTDTAMAGRDARGIGGFFLENATDSTNVNVFVRAE